MGSRIPPTSDKFDVLRKRAKQQAGAETQGQTEALQRRFARIGGLSSGAAIKQDTLARERGAGRLQQATEGIDLAQAQEQERKQEIGEARKFATGEREASQTFGAEQSALGRRFATAERLGGQQFAGEQAGLGRQFAGEQAGLGRQFASSERLAGQQFAGEQAGLGRAQQASQFERTQGFQEGQAAFSRLFAGEQFAEQKRQFDTTATEETRINNFNVFTALQQLELPPQQIQGILNSIGATGLGDTLQGEINRLNEETAAQNQARQQRGPAPIKGRLRG